MASKVLVFTLILLVGLRTSAGCAPADDVSGSFIVKKIEPTFIRCQTNVADYGHEFFWSPHKPDTYGPPISVPWDKLTVTQKGAEYVTVVSNNGRKLKVGDVVRLVLKDFCCEPMTYCDVHGDKPWVVACQNGATRLSEFMPATTKKRIPKK